MRGGEDLSAAKPDGRKKKKADPSQEFIDLICSLYGDTYDDREEDSRPGGEDWEPGMKALHTSLAEFQKELKDIHDITLSTAKIRKILITGNCWTTERSREVAELYERYQSISRVAAELGVSDALVTMYLPYGKVVYDLEDKSGGAKRVQRWRERQANTPDPRALAVAVLREHRGESDELLYLWRAVIAYEGFAFTTSGRGSRPGVEYKYEVSSPGGKSGRRYSGVDVGGYGNELWIIVDGERRGKSISRSTVDLAYKNGLALMEAEGAVKGPKALGIPGAGSYLYPVLLEFGVIVAGK